MMRKSKSNNIVLLKYLYVVPILMFLTILWSKEEVHGQSLELNKAIKTESKGEVYKIVEEMPRFPGCEDLEKKQEKKNCSQKGLLSFIFSNLKYPKVAKENDVQGLVVVSFVIDTEGKVQNPKVLRDIGAGCGEEALRVVQSMPQWVPGKQNGKKVDVQINLPIRYKFDKKQVATSEENKQLLKGKKLPEGALLISPNPTQGLLEFTFKGSQTLSHVVVSDTNGKIVFQNTYDQLNGDFWQTLDLSNQANGIYFISLVQGEAKISKQFVLQKVD